MTNTAFESIQEGQALRVFIRGAWQLDRTGKVMTFPAQWVRPGTSDSRLRSPLGGTYAPWTCFPA